MKFLVQNDIETEMFNEFNNKKPPDKNEITKSKSRNASK
jgi:hypothetical protein